ncbi:MAG: amidohydrolase [Candidatus Limivivens sp.]|nr:amidohydrolase [Candidatus Limivivens sp.]
MNFRKESEAIEDYIVETRRYLHARPELSFEEKETTEFLEQELTKLGLQPQRYEDFYGVWADLCGGKSTPESRTVVLRADIDALPIQEETGLAYASQRKGVMHACGHDSHAAMLLGAARLLVSHQDELPGRVRLLFQAAEESCHGAEYYVKKGILDGADAIYGCHVWATLDAPYINIDDGARMSSCDNFTITVKGAAAHGSAPNYGVDAIVTAAAIILQLQTIVSRKSDPRDTLAITIGEIAGGPRFNIISDQVVMKGTARTHNPEVRGKIEGWIRNIAENVARANGAEAVVEYESYPGVLLNDPAVSEIARQAVRELYGQEGLGSHPILMGSEDFSYFLDQVPGAYALIGVRNEEKGITSQNHNSRFQVDESVLKRGAALYAQFAYDFLIESERAKDSILLAVDEF